MFYPFIPSHPTPPPILLPLTHPPATFVLKLVPPAQSHESQPPWIFKVRYSCNTKMLAFGVQRDNYIKVNVNRYFLTL